MKPLHRTIALTSVMLVSVLTANAAPKERPWDVVFQASRIQQVSEGHLRQTSVFRTDALGRLWLEAEEAIELEMEGEERARMDLDASGGLYVHQPRHLRVRFHLEQGGRYHAWHRARVPRSDQWQHRQQIGTGERLNIPGLDDETDAHSAWTWIPGPIHEIKAGEHEWILLDFGQDVQLDKFLLSPYPDYVPSGTGDPARRLNALTEDEVRSEWIHAGAPVRWLRVDGEWDMRDAILRMEARRNPEEKWVCLGTDRRFPFTEDSPSVQLRLIIQSATDGRLPWIQHLRVISQIGNVNE